MPKRHPSSAPVSQAAAISKPTTDLAPPAIAESHRTPELSGAAPLKSAATHSMPNTTPECKPA
jgi:hypothetical protein